MNKIELMLGGILMAVVVALSGGFYAFVVVQPAEKSRSTAATTEMVEIYNAVHETESTNDFRLVTEAAKNWSSDAQWLSANVTFVDLAATQGGRGQWTYSFYSASKEKTALLAITDAGPILFSQRTLRRRLPVGPLTAWPGGLDRVLATFMQSGGWQFVANHSEAQIKLEVRNDPVAQSIIGLFDIETGHSLTYTFDAFSHELLNVRQIR